MSPAATEPACGRHYAPAGDEATLSDIADRKGLKFKELEAATLLRSDEVRNHLEETYKGSIVSAAEPVGS